MVRMIELRYLLLRTKTRVVRSPLYGPLDSSIRSHLRRGIIETVIGNFASSNDTVVAGKTRTTRRIEEHTEWRVFAAACYGASRADSCGYLYAKRRSLDGHRSRPRGLSSPRLAQSLSRTSEASNVARPVEFFHVAQSPRDNFRTSRAAAAAAVAAAIVSRRRTRPRGGPWRKNHAESRLGETAVMIKGENKETPRYLAAPPSPPSPHLFSLSPGL